MKEIRKRLEALERIRLPGESYVLCRMPDGSEREMPVKEWALMPDAMFRRFTKGFDPRYKDVSLLIKFFDEEARAMRKGG